VLLIDLDHFRDINDTFGYSAGDLVLQEVSALLASINGENDVLARMGDDQFGLLLTGTKSDEKAVDIARKILDSFIRDQISVDGNKSNVCTSIGISVYPPAEPDSDTLIRNASMALRAAKIKGHQYVLHSVE
jgi:diguanylate cyclase (GGDEF)-like protein